ncbi:MAG: lysophospholipid acyltransferase family protein [Cytophagales bacterium]|nr:lysophospholipid acyltransferase family protein [Bernardetiaceae bacterium]MDW8210295.1 lysophospholipid acyltransferase family protein [Cytophagales bacterium]
MPEKTLITPEEFARSLNLDKLQLQLLARPLMKLLKLDKLNELYNQALQYAGLEFIDKALEMFQVKYEVPEGEQIHIPRTGPFIVVANHPYGGIDGMILISILSKIRPDFRIMANYLLNVFEPIRQYFIPVNPFDNPKNRQVNVAGVKAALEHLKQGSPVGIFPAGEVSSYQPESNKITDKQWHPLIGKIVQKAKVDVVPVYFSGHNSVFFNLLGMIHPHLRTARLPSEMFNKAENKIVVRIGKPIPFAELETLNDSDQILRYLRARTYALGSSLKVKPFFRNPFKRNPKPEPIVPPVPVELLQADIDHIRPTDCLFAHGPYEVFFSEATAIPNILREIGRLREITFRQEGEGTNHSIDIDEYDVHYHHLFIWDKEAQRIVGAYRMGKGKELYAKFKIKGFYLSTLFKIDKKFAPILKKSIEMGRSFIVKDYQRKHLSLMLLWKGVLLILRRFPEYRYLIGPVSISNTFSHLSKELVVQVIKNKYFDYELAKYVKPRRKFEPKFKDGSDALLLPKYQDIKELDLLISSIETSHSKLPVLLKKYILQLNAKIIGFNIDPKFNNALDGFIIMDFEKVPEEVIKMLSKESIST